LWGSGRSVRENKNKGRNKGNTVYTVILMESITSFMVCNCSEGSSGPAALMSTKSSHLLYEDDYLFEEENFLFGLFRHT
jgi:hypothetical protein